MNIRVWENTHRFPVAAATQLYVGEGGVGEHVRRTGDAVTGVPADCE